MPLAGECGNRVKRIYKSDNAFWEEVPPISILRWLSTHCETTLLHRAILNVRFLPSSSLLTSTLFLSALPRLFLSFSRMFTLVLRSAIADESGPQFKCQIVGCNRWFKSTLAYEGHYNTCHRYVRTPRLQRQPRIPLTLTVQSCNTCGRMFPIARLLELHVLETHDTLFALLAKKQNMVMPSLALAWALNRCMIKTRSYSTNAWWEDAIASLPQTRIEKSI